MKLIFLGSSFSIVWYMRRHKIVRRSYDKDQDTFRHYFLVLPCLFLALVINEKFTFKEVCFYLSFINIVQMLVIISSYLTIFTFFNKIFAKRRLCLHFPHFLSYASHWNWPGHVDIFFIFRSGGHTSSAHTVTENKKYWQLNRAIYISSRVCYFFNSIYETVIIFKNVGLFIFLHCIQIGNFLC